MTKKSAPSQVHASLLPDCWGHPTEVGAKGTGREQRGAPPSVDCLPMPLGFRHHTFPDPSPRPGSQQEKESHRRLYEEKQHAILSCPPREPLQFLVVTSPPCPLSLPTRPPCPLRMASIPSLVLYPCHLCDLCVCPLSCHQSQEDLGHPLPAPVTLSSPTACPPCLQDHGPSCWLDSRHIQLTPLTDFQAVFIGLQVENQ